MFYHDQCKRVVSKFRRRLITKDEAYVQLHEIERTAYRHLQIAEPDGDITYCTACAADEIDEYNQHMEADAKSCAAHA